MKIVLTLTPLVPIMDQRVEPVGQVISSTRRGKLRVAANRK